MNRRSFIKISGFTALCLAYPSFLSASGINYKDFKFDYSLVDKVDFKNAGDDKQILVIYLSGGASQLAGNMTNFEEIKKFSESKYSKYEVTENGFWKNAGGDIMEELLKNKQLSIVRTIFREKLNLRSHNEQAQQNQRGSWDETTSGIFADILYQMQKNDNISETSILPSVSFKAGLVPMFDKADLKNYPIYLNPANMGKDLDNPYEMKLNKSLNTEFSSEEKIQKLANEMNQINSENNIFQEKLAKNFTDRVGLDDFIKNIKDLDVGVEYANNDYAKNIKSALTIMNENKDTKFSYIEFGGWDNHSGAARNYEKRVKDIFTALKTGLQYLKNKGNKKISIWIFSEFGRNVNLNKSLGWDHGNIQNLYVLSNNAPYLKMGKIIGETEIFKPDPTKNRMYQKPTGNSVKYEPLSIGSSFYKLFGFKNPDLFTNEPVISELIN